nr:adiponectin receptor protein-like [Leptinotarsa decemlineata]
MSHYSDAEDSTDVQDIETVLRKRKIWDPETESITSEIKELLEEDVNSLLVEEDCVGCPLPSTPEDENILDSEMSDVLKAAVLGDDLDISALAHNAASQAEHVVRKMIQAGWSVCHFRNLPAWLQDNDYLVFGHRPPLPSFRACFKSIFRLHTETANIWTHLLGCVAFIGVFGCLRINGQYKKLISRRVINVDSVTFLQVVCALGITSIMVSLWDKFSESGWRPFRAGVFMTFGLSGIVPAIHYGIVEGWFNYVSQKYLGWLVLMGVLYIVGALFYALRVPERWFPGKCDIWFHSHQIFHVFVLGGALVHYHGISEMAMHRVTIGQCEMSDSPIY